MNPILIGISIYLSLGAVLLAIFDLATKRIRSKFTQATSETQSRLLASGNYVSSRLASVLFLSAMWLFWPIVFIGAITDKKEDSHGTQEPRADCKD